MKAFANPICDPLHEQSLLELIEIILFSNSKTLNTVAQSLLSGALTMDSLGKSCDQVLPLKAYGYPIGGSLQENKPLEFNEVTLSADSKTIIAVSQFLIKASADMDRLGEAYEHLHMQGNSPFWEDHWPDIIVCKLQDEKP